MIRILYFILISTMLACQPQEGRKGSNELVFELPAHFDQPTSPDDNPTTLEKVKLGEQLFYDPILSKSKKISCSSCHLPQLAFADGRALSIGEKGRKGERNSPGLTNVVYNKSFFAEGGVSSLEQQLIGPLQNEHEMNLNLAEAVDRLNQSNKYSGLFNQVFDTTPTAANLVRAIAAYERTLISYNSPYDSFKMDFEKALNAKEIEGKMLFFGKAGCSNCHSGFNFTNNSYANNGIDSIITDEGRWRITGKGSDSGKFKVPGLRNVELTGPYMHDGSMRELSEVIAHYNKGGLASSYKSDLIKPLYLSKKEEEQLLAFLKSLTDEAFIEKHTKRMAEVQKQP